MGSIYFIKNLVGEKRQLTPTTLYYFSSIKNGFIYFFSSSGMQQSLHLAGCHATGISSLLIFFKYFTLFKYTTLSYKSNINDNFRIIFIKINIIEVDIFIFTLRTSILSLKMLHYQNLY